MKPQKWNTGRLTIYGAFGGLTVGVIRAWPTIIQGDIASSLGYVVGSAVGVATLVALASGIRNLFIRSN